MLWIINQPDDDETYLVIRCAANGEKTINKKNNHKTWTLRYNDHLMQRYGYKDTMYNADFDMSVSGEVDDRWMILHAHHHNWIAIVF